ncbi:2-amino-4-hydroxy-6-hydroxymethyldihydropteridine diphosphokinase [Salisaeta longa]|uniref:2-amino-4-hydroxy-6- hydroxymethyldihydropteridine diphosphokinase n=1 Tax=Salisaeta longa TaxID=503170 RepID=UPI0003B763F8|nr:2-amino-4-hydroxy-6-hydroxymethyldihydropteridine diphosphokinase [Salisaeta longa]
MPDPVLAFAALGANLGDRCARLQQAVDALAALAHTRIVNLSDVYETEAHTRSPTDTQPDYLNAVVALRTAQSPEALLDASQRIEQQAGRKRSPDAPRWQPRPLDIDWLAVGPHTCSTARLTLPHPRLADRRFVLRPWADCAPNFHVPAPFETTVHALLHQCPDRSACRPAVSCTLTWPSDA